MILNVTFPHQRTCSWAFVKPEVILLYWSKYLQTRISPEVRQVSSFPSFSRIFKLCTIFLNVKCFGFIFRMRNASPFANPILTPLKKCLRAGTTPARRWVSINESLRSYPYIDKNRGVVDKDPFRCYIKFILEIWKVFLITKPYKRLENTKIKPDFSGLFNT